MLYLLDQMKESLQKEFGRAFTDYLDKDIGSWVQDLPAQIVTCGLQTLWTAQIEKVNIRLNK